MILHIRNTCFSMILLIFVRDTVLLGFLINIRIDFGSMLAPLWHTFSCFVAIISLWFWGWYFWRFLSKNTPKTCKPGPSFSSLFRPCCARGVLGGPLSHFGTLLAPFRVHVDRFWHLFGSMFRRVGIKTFPFATRIHTASVPEPQTPSPKKKTTAASLLYHDVNKQNKTKQRYRVRFII